MKPYKLLLWVVLPLSPVSLQAKADGTTSCAHKNFAKPEKGCLQDSRSEQRAAGPESLELAKTLDSLGAEALKREDLQKAEEYYRQVLEIRERLAPDSFALADTLNNLGRIAERRADLAKAKEYYKRTLSIRQKLAPENLGAAETLNILGNIAIQTGNLADAEQYLQQSLDIRRRLAPGSRSVAMTLIVIGNLFWNRGDVLKQEQCFQQALSIGEKLDPIDTAAVLDAVGNAGVYSAHPEKAEEYIRRALEIRQKLTPDSLAVAMSLTNLGNIVMFRGDPARAEEYLRQALEMRRKLAPGSLIFAASLNNLGTSVQTRGNLLQAEEYFRQALEIKQSIAPKSLAVAESLYRLGIIFWIREDLPKAEEYLHQALEIRRQLAPQSSALVQSLNWVGLVSDRRGDMAQAEAYFREALEISEKSSPESFTTSQVLASLGSVAQRQGDLAQAEEYFRRALAIQEKLAPESPEKAVTLQKLGDLARRRQDLASAEKYFRQTLLIREKKVPGSMAHANALFDLASVLRRQQQGDAAAELFSQATDIVENQAPRLGGTEENRSFFRARYEARYKDYIDLLIAQKKPELAFHVLERSRARSLLELLASAQIDIRNGCDPELLRQERSLREAISAKSNYRFRLLHRPHTEKRAAVLDQQIAGLQEQYDEVEAQIRLKSPAYAALTQPQPLNAKEVQEQLLDGNTLLLEYSLGDGHSYVWAVSQTSLTVYPLPSRKIIEQAAQKVHDLLIEQSKRVTQETAPVRQMRFAQAETEYAKASAELSKMVLGPVAPLIETKRLLIVSDGALQYVPFAALPEPGLPTSTAVPTPPTSAFWSSSGITVPLVMEHEIVNLPSASVLAQLRQTESNRKEPPLAVAVLADPVFDEHDERVIASQAQKHLPIQRMVASRFSAQESSLSPERSTRSAVPVSAAGERGTHFQRLLWTRREAEAILKVTPAGQGMKALGFQASRATAMSPLLAQYRIVHFATHAVLNSEHPELSGLVFSLVDEHGHPQNGFLDLEQIYNLNLPADMVVLSACDTGLGQQISGEGLIGLARGFMYAGASRVVASLWKVDDEVTAELMARFYKALEQDKLSPAAALRVAQIQIAQEGRWNSPYYWAGFQIVGEWK